MASVNPYPPNDNKNYAYNQSIRSDDEETLSEHFASFAQAELLAMPLGGNEDSQPVDHIARTIINSPVGSHLEEARFFMSSIITSHISPKLSDFKTLTSILPYPVKELGGVYAVGQGTIDVLTDITTGRKLTLQHVLFVPFARERLISVTSLCQDGMHCVFDSVTCWVTDEDDTTVARGAVSRGLFFLSVKVPFVTPFELAPLQQERTHSVDMLTRTPNIETWHRRLGHCSTQTVIDMARNCTVDGITIDVSVAPPKCVNCVLGKQACMPGPIQWEGIQAKRPLEQVYIELWGPMSVVSQSGYLYTAFIVDDFSSYMWSLPLRSKDEAAAVLTPWKCTIENLSGHRLKTLVTKDSGPISRSMPDWCALHGIEHQVTASPQNGRIECLRHMIIGKTRSTRLACNAPLSLWDEFLATTTYLTTLTVSIKYGGKTPYELWKGHPPSLSHLREIGCFAFALTATQDPKVYQYSEPCILVGYMFRIKEYRLWNPASGMMFKTPHVLFIEHLDTVPANLKPGASFSIASNATLPSWDAPVSAPVFTATVAQQAVVEV
jgi:hypothetical protein